MQPIGPDRRRDRSRQGIYTEPMYAARFDAAEEARVRLQNLGRRWSHVQAVAAVAQHLGVNSDVVDAAWLHDVGYAPELRLTGFHPVDGAAHLAGLGLDAEVVGLVAFHSGAEYEAEERGLAGDLAKFARPDQRSLEALTYADMTVGPDGRRVTVDDRIAEIMDRYSDDDPVHRAVTRSEDYLRECVARVEASAEVRGVTT